MGPRDIAYVGLFEHRHAAFVFAIVGRLRARAAWHEAEPRLGVHVGGGRIPCRSKLRLWSVPCIAHVSEMYPTLGQCARPIRRGSSRSCHDADDLATF